jgi:predicted anti-sigma-YlaC factor YlaD
MASLNVAVTIVFTATAVAPFIGTVEMTVGGGAVVKVHTKFAASGAPVGSFAPVVIVAVYKVLVARSTAGVKVAVVPA